MVGQDDEDLVILAEGSDQFGQMTRTSARASAAISVNCTDDRPQAFENRQLVLDPRWTAGDGHFLDGHSNSLLFFRLLSVPIFRYRSSPEFVIVARMKNVSSQIYGGKRP